MLVVAVTADGEPKVCVRPLSITVSGSGFTTSVTLAVPVPGKVLAEAAAGVYTTESVCDPAESTVPTS